MRFRLPLSAKILAWFFLNLAVLGVAFFLFARVQFHLGPDWLMAGRAGERVQAVVDVIAAELGDHQHAEWNAILKRFSDAYHVEFALVRNDGARVAGDTTTVPAVVREKLSERPGPRQPPRAPEFRDGPGMREPGRPADPLREPGVPRGNGILPLAIPNPGTNLNPNPNPKPARGKFVVRSESPVRYWVGIRLAGLERDSFRPGGLTLLISSESLRGGGLFIDLTPWIIVGFAAVLFSVLFWIPLITGITRSVAQMTRATELIAEGSFDARVVTNRRDELGSLGEAINRMAMRLAGFVSGQKRFLGDIAHELCAPLARLQMALGILEQRAGQQPARVDDVREEVQHMSSLVNELLSFSKASLRQEPVELEPVALAALARRIIEREAKAGEIIEIRIDPILHAVAEPELLARALSNLVRNALRHAGDTGPLVIAARRQDDRVQLTISDSGPGIPEDARETIFDPFYRLEASRSRETGGVGLGLAIVRTCVEACGGTVSARNRQPHGLEVQIVLRAANSGSRQVLPTKP